MTSLLVEGGGEVNASFLFGGFAQRAALFYAPKILGDSRFAKKLWRALELKYSPMRFNCAMCNGGG